MPLGRRRFHPDKAGQAAYARLFNACLADMPKCARERPGPPSSASAEGGPGAAV